MHSSELIARHNARVLCHSSKGSTWKDHKYIRKEGDKYVYVESGSGSNSTSSSGDSASVSDSSKEKFDLDQMANKVIRGEFGNGADRKELLGDTYDEIQARVNEILKSGSSGKSSSGSSKTTMSQISNDRFDTGKSYVSSLIKNKKIRGNSVSEK